LSVGLKEASETEYWLKLLYRGKYITDTMFNSIQPQVKELIKLLVTSIKTAKENNKETR
jgi:four helix bundle protein